MNTWPFIAKLMPALLELGHDLFRRHRGNAEAAAVEIERLRDHGAKFQTAEAGMRAELEELAAEDTKREKP